MPDNGKFLSTPDAARYISRHRSTLDKWRAENLVLPYYRDGLKVWYAVDDLDAYLNSKRVEPIAYGSGCLDESIISAA